MARYNRWMNERLYGACAELTDAERKRDLGAFFRSLHGTLNHVLLADRIWLGRFAGDAIVVRSLAEELYADFDVLSVERAKTDADIEAFVAALGDEDLSATLSYATSGGKPSAHPAWWALSHFFNHQTHHRGQATTLLSQLGRDVGSTDLIAMLRTG